MGVAMQTGGSVAINLSEFAWFQQQMQIPTTVRRFLFTESKLNATLKQHNTRPGGSGAGEANGMGGQDIVTALAATVLEYVPQNHMGFSANIDQYYRYHNPCGGGSGFGAPRLL
ncbi:hypothetical protein HK100_002074 [Physocladia obscura]|uniref:Uncharacterized protein n=1 Tax=Physocladia obscura TaxID=109957 RepID=A0AAD5XG91_9FUNG|nr:hypothetical protein HK100_002074 [Physocladia obscura]